MNIEEAIKTALEYEVKIRDIYAQGAEKIKEEKGKKIFKTLADDEQSHVDYLEYRLKEWKESGVINVEKLESVIPPREAIEKAAREVGKLMPEKILGDIKLLLGPALKAEVETSNFYKKMVDEMEGPAREMFARFLEIEESHIVAVEAELAHAGQTGFWFDFMEKDMEEGWME